MKFLLVEFLGSILIVLTVLWLLWKYGISRVLWVKYLLKKQQINEVNDVAKDAAGIDKDMLKKNRESIEKVLTDEEDTNIKEGVVDEQSKQQPESK